MQKKYRAVLFSNISSSAKEFNFSKLHIFLFTFTCLLVLVSVGAVGVSLLSDYLYSFKLGLIQQERNTIRSSLLEMNREFTGLENRLEKLFALDKDLRLLNDLETFDPVLREVGIGGGIEIPASQSEFFFTEMELLSNISTQKLGKLKYLIEMEEKSYSAIFAGLQEHKEWLRYYPSADPLKGGRVTSWFGWRDSPYESGKREFHQGVDILVPRGTPVYATANGFVDVVSQNDLRNGLGRYIKIKHMTEKYGWTTIYGHLLKFEPGIKKGVAVRKGQKIAEVGSSGRSTSPHLHYGLQYIDPKTGIKKYVDPRLEHWNPNAFGY